jgi:hypothetical protein
MISDLFNHEQHLALKSADFLHKSDKHHHFTSLEHVFQNGAVFLAERHGSTVGGRKPGTTGTQRSCLSNISAETAAVPALFFS